MSFLNIKFLPWVCVVVVSLLCLWLLYLIIDQSVTLDHQEQHTKLILGQRDSLVKVVNATGASIDKSSLVKYLSNNPKHEFFEKGDDIIVVDHVSFLFKNDQLSRIDVGQ